MLKLTNQRKSEEMKENMVFRRSSKFQNIMKVLGVSEKLFGLWVAIINKGITCMYNHNKQFFSILTLLSFFKHLDSDASLLFDKMIKTSNKT